MAKSTIGHQDSTQLNSLNIKFEQHFPPEQIQKGNPQEMELFYVFASN
jgi:hypothetical protein